MYIIFKHLNAIKRKCFYKLFVGFDMWN